jgi:hypothetical protein
MAAATYNYNGTNQLAVSLTGLTSGHSYVLICGDDSSSPVSGIASGGGTLTLTQTGISNPAGETFEVRVYDNTAATQDDVVCNVFQYGTASTDGFGFTTTWSYDGAHSVSVDFTAANGVDYELDVRSNNIVYFTSPYTGTGAAHTLTLNTFPAPPGASFFAVLYHDESGDTVFRALSDRIFATGVADAGSPGNPEAAPTVAGRVLIAFDDGPHEPSPTFVAIDQGGDFPDQFCGGYDTKSGKQTLLSQTETGTATVYINDHEDGPFDPRNVSSPYFGKLDGRQILLQLYNPVTTVWESQFQGWIDYMTWDVDGSSVDAAGDPVNVRIQLECVDIFEELNRFGLTPGLAGDVPPSGMEDGVYYAEAHVDDRQIQILADVGIDSTRYGSPSLASGNVNVREVKYDPGESALSALRDAADAEFPWISNIYADRFGKYQFRGRYGRFAPDSVAAEPGSDWDFTRWAVGDGKAIVADSARAQMRVLSFQRGRNEILNVAICWPKNTTPAQMPSQVYADATSVVDFGQFAAPPMSDLLTADDTLESGNPNARVECFDYAKLLVLNQKDPRESISALQVKTVHPSDARATTTWAFLTQSDISHIVNVAVGYPGGTGFTGASPEDDYYIEGRQLRVRPMEPGFDYVELDVEVSPAVWSMDTHGVFPPFS